MNKRGVSAVVATVLIILITIAAVTILWAAVIPMLKEKLAFEEVGVDLTIETIGGYTVWDEENNLASVQVRRGNDDANITEVQIIFICDGESITFYESAPKQGQAKTYYYRLWRKPSKVRVAPVYYAGETRKTGGVLSSADLVKGRIDEEGKIIKERIEDFISSWSVLNMPFDKAGSPTKDYSEYGNDGVVYGATWSPTGGVGGSGAYEFGGTTSNCVIVLYDEIFNFTKSRAFSSAGWFKRKGNSTNANNYAIGNAFGSWGMKYGSAGSSNIHCQFHDGITWRVSTYTLSEHIDGVWHQAICVWNGTHIIAYVDGKPATAASTTNLRSSTNNIEIGRSWYSPFNGTIDEVLIFNMALTPQQVKALYEKYQI